LADKIFSAKIIFWRERQIKSPVRFLFPKTRSADAIENFVRLKNVACEATNCPTRFGTIYDR